MYLIHVLGKKMRNKIKRQAFTDLALFAGDGSVPGFSLTHLTLQSRVSRFLIFFYDMLHCPVFG